MPSPAGCGRLSRRLDDRTVTMAGGKGDPTTRNFLRAVETVAGEPDGTLKGWGTDAPGYRVDDFYIGSTDGRGHNQVIHVPVPTNVAGHMTSMVQLRTFSAYRSVQDFVRDAIVHRMHQLAEMTEDPQEAQDLRDLVSMEILGSATERHARRLEALRSLAYRANENLGLAAGEQDWITLRKMLGLYEDMLGDLDEPWYGRLETVLEEYRRRLPD